jgi:hypothetical protein
VMPRAGAKPRRRRARRGARGFRRLGEALRKLRDPSFPRPCRASRTWSRSSRAASPSAGPAAPGPKRTPNSVSPGAMSTTTGPVAGPATTRSPSWPQTTSMQPSGRTPLRVPFGSRGLAPHTAGVAGQRSRHRALDVLRAHSRLLCRRGDAPLALAGGPAPHLGAAGSTRPWRELAGV